MHILYIQRGGGVGVSPECTTLGHQGRKFKRSEGGFGPEGGEGVFLSHTGETAPWTWARLKSSHVIWEPKDGPARSCEAGRGAAGPGFQKQPHSSANRSMLHTSTRSLGGPLAQQPCRGEQSNERYPWGPLQRLCLPSSETRLAQQCFGPPWRRQLPLSSATVAQVSFWLCSLRGGCQLRTRGVGWVGSRPWFCLLCPKAALLGAIWGRS